MTERVLAELIRRELLDNGRKCILVRNIHQALNAALLLSSVLDEMRIVIVDCTDFKSLRTSLIAYFMGESSPSPETAFEAGWRSHCTEISLFSEIEGLEIAAGLQSIKSDVKNFLCNDSSLSLNGSALASIFSSFLWSLPTVICFINYSERSGDPVSVLLEDTRVPAPPVVVFRNDSGNLAGSDSIIESGMMSMDSIRSYLVKTNSPAPPEKVMLATGGNEGLVKLCAGLYPYACDHQNTDLFAMLDAFLLKNSDLSLFAHCAALFGMQFLPGEISLLSGLQHDTLFALGRKINLWNGHYVGCFVSEDVHKHILKDTPKEEKDRFLKRAVEIVHEFRGENSRTYQTAGDLQVRAGLFLSASESYRIAAEKSNSELRKADLYRRAALFAKSEREHFLFMAALNLYKGEFYPEAIEILKTIDNNTGSAIRVLWGMCLSWSDDSFHNDITGETGIPELVSEILESRRFQKLGNHYKAERILLDCAIEDTLSSVVCLVELGEQLYKRGLVESSYNTMTTARIKAEMHGAKWLERKALFVSVKALNRLGKLDQAGLRLSRLIELTLLSGNRRKLVTIYNLYANLLLISKKYSEALEIYSSALRILSTVPESQAVKITILNNMGVAERQLFRTGDSLRTLMRQVRISVSSGNLSQACIAYGNMARIFIHLNRTDAAEDCLESMIEFAHLGKITEAAEPILYISSQIAFLRGDTESAFSLINQSIQLSSQSGKKRRLSLGLVKKGSMFLRMNRYESAVETLTEAIEVSKSAGTNLNLFLSEMKLTAAKCFMGHCLPSELLSVKHRGNPEDTHKGEQMYYHWLLTGSRQSMASAAQLLSRGLSHGLYLHSYLHMLQDIRKNIPLSLANAIPLVHNYPSCD